MEELNKLFNKFSANKKHYSLGWGKNPLRDWKIIFISAAMLSLVLIAVCTNLFFDVEKVGISAPDTDTDQALSVPKLNRTVEYYEAKKTEFDQIKSSKEALADPSANTAAVPATASTTETDTRSH